MFFQKAQWSIQFHPYFTLFTYFAFPHSVLWSQTTSFVCIEGQIKGENLRVMVDTTAYEAMEKSFPISCCHALVVGCFS